MGRVSSSPSARRITGRWRIGKTSLVQEALERSARERELDDASQTIRLGTCKRQGDKLVADLARFKHHVKSFLAVVPKFSSWSVERVAIAPALTAQQRSAIEAFGYVAQDLSDLTAWL